MPNSAGRGALDDRWIDAFRLEAAGALLPLLAETLQQAAHALRRDDGGASPLEGDLSVLRAGLIGYEQRWQRELQAGFQDWPRASTPAQSGLSLLSNEELGSQLIGEPTIEALERRFRDVLDHTSSRLHTLSSGIGQDVRPSNPVAPRALVEALLRAIPGSDCVEELRLVLLAQFERVCAVRLADFYSRINQQLAESGYALQSGGQETYAALDPRDRNAVADAEAAPGWRQRVRETAGGARADSPRATALRGWARGLADADAPGDARVLFDREFDAVLSLLRADPDTAPQPGPEPIAVQLQAQVLRSASSLGIASGSARLSPEQSDACVLAGALVEGLVGGHAFGDEARGVFARMVHPLCHQVLTDPALFDEPAHPGRLLLDELCWSLDANVGANPDEAAIRDAALAAGQEVLSDMHDPERAFGHALASLQATLEPLRARAALGRKRLAQRVAGRARLEQARTAADAALTEAIGERALVAPVVDFLSGPWHHALMQARLRHGEGSDAFDGLAASARALVALDERAARGEGGAIARGVLALEPALREILLASGVDGAHADAQLGQVVRALADPDHRRAAGPGVAGCSAGQGRVGSGARFAAEIGDWLTLDDGPGASRLQVAWRAPDADRCLLLDRCGQRALSTDVVDLAPLHAAGRLRLHRAHGAVEDLFQAWERAAAAG